MSFSLVSMRNQLDQKLKLKVKRKENKIACNQESLYAALFAKLAGKVRETCKLLFSVILK